MSTLTAEAMSGASRAVSDMASQTQKLAELITEMKNA